MLTDDQRAGLARAVELFNAGGYFKCHEVLEEIWHPAAEPQRTFLKGLIHAAVALYQYQRGNSHGARVKAASCRRYLEPYEPEYGGIEVRALREDLARFIAPLNAVPGGTTPPVATTPWPRLHLLPAEQTD